METKEFKSFYKEVKGNEGTKCHYPTRLDTYGCGCPFNCNYCYARSLLEFRKLWNPTNPSEADIEKIRRKIRRLPEGTPRNPTRRNDRLLPTQGTQDPPYVGDHQSVERTPTGISHRHQVEPRERGAVVGYPRPRTRARAGHHHLLRRREYRELHYEAAPIPSKRIEAVERLNKAGIDVQVRLSPFIPEFVDYDRLAAIDCDKLLVEFLRVNSKIEKIFTTVDFTPYTLKQGGYHHLPLVEKKEAHGQHLWFQRSHRLRGRKRSLRVLEPPLQPKPRRLL